MRSEDKVLVFGWIGIIVTILLVIGGVMWVWPNYNVYRAERAGKAVLVEAESSRLVQIEEAKANLEAERLNAEAEVVRAQGVSDSIDIEGGKLTDQYIRYLWVKNLDYTDTKVIYLPTEAGLPVLNQPIEGLPDN